MKKVIVVFRNFHDIDIHEIWPEIIKIPKEKAPEEFLRELWEDSLNSAISEGVFNDDPVDEENSWYEEDHAQITWSDKDTKVFYIVETEE